MRQTELIGQVVGKRAAAKQARGRRSAPASRSPRAAPERHPSVLLVLGLGRSVQAFMPNSWGGDVIAQAGGRLLTKGLESATEQGFAKLSDEIIVQRNPDIIIAVPHGPISNIPRIAAEPARQPGVEEHEGGEDETGLCLDRQLAAAGDAAGRLGDRRRADEVPEEPVAARLPTAEMTRR